VTYLADPIDGPPVESQVVATARRVDSVDALRGLTILLMVFVNDLGRNAPSWMHHIRPPRADGMTLADIVFPWFLFIVGVSIPLAFERAFAAGATTRGQVGHILARTASLLLLGVIEMNSGDHRGMLGPLWAPLAFVAILLAWAIVPKEPGPRRSLFMALKAVGVIGLLGLLAIYRREPVDTRLPFLGPVENWGWLRTEWWGILGLIGWAYLTVALLTLWLGRRREWLAGAIGVLILLHLAMRRGGLFTHVDGKAWLGAARPLLKSLSHAVDGLGQYVGLGDATGSLAAITMAGCLLGSILRRGSDVATPEDRVSWTKTFIVGLLIAGFMTDTFEGINKIGATPTWCLWSAALAASAWLLLYLIIDVAGRRAWSIVVRPAGANPLVAYFLHPIVTESIDAAGFGGALLGYKDSSNPAIVVAGSFAMAIVICGLTGLLARLGLRVRL
jgi:predicted acyltransferase